MIESLTELFEYSSNTCTVIHYYNNFTGTVYLTDMYIHVIKDSEFDKLASYIYMQLNIQLYSIRSYNYSLTICSYNTAWPAAVAM